MSGSVALQHFELALDEVSSLLSASPTIQRGIPPKKIASSIGRAGIVLLCSHYERYFYAVNEEAAAAVCGWTLKGALFPKSLKLHHTKIAIELIEGTQWNNRGDKLEDFILTDGWLWSEHLDGQLIADRLLAWMKSPKPDDIKRYYRLWDIDDIFEHITRKASIKGEFYRRLQGLVDKRNAIAHGDAWEQATPKDVRAYASSARKFCRRVDNALSRQLSKIFRQPRPW